MKNFVAPIVAMCFTVALYAGDGTIVRSRKPVAGSYIVVLASTDSAPASVASEFRHTQGVKPVHIYDLALNGFSFIGTEAAARAISADPRVKRVEEDGLLAPHAQLIKQSAPSWGLDRIDQQTLPLDHTYAYEYAGYGAVIYVVDTGVNPLSDFQGRVRERVNFVPDRYGNLDPNDVNDCSGHGTGVADLAAGYQWGVAKQAQVVSVRVGNCDGAFDVSWVIAGVDWMVRDHQTLHPYEPAVANMSFGSIDAIVPSIDDVVMNAVKAGITVVASAGNNFADACGVSPARLGNPNSYPTPAMSSVITVGMTSQSDSFVYESQTLGSNYGRCVDILAPGRYVSTLDNHGIVQSGWGTSFAAPLVSGVAAIHMERYPGIVNMPASIEGIIKDAGTVGVITGFLNGSPNLLLYNSVPRRRACC